jgi:transcriptional regulator with XRE-family HTH domain
MNLNGFLMGSPNDVSAGLRRFRSRHGLSQTDLATLSGVSLRTLQNLEAQGVRPSSMTVLRLDVCMRKFERSAQKRVAA